MNAVVHVRKIPYAPICETSRKHNTFILLMELGAFGLQIMSICFAWKRHLVIIIFIMIRPRGDLAWKRLFVEVISSAHTQVHNHPMVVRHDRRLSSADISP
jgi:hypothetical protein